MLDADIMYATTWRSLRNIVVVNLTSGYSSTIENKNGSQIFLNVLKWTKDLNEVVILNDYKKPLTPNKLA